MIVEHRTYTSSKAYFILHHPILIHFVTYSL
jgi:hypothetical protein